MQPIIIQGDSCLLFLNLVEIAVGGQRHGPLTLVRRVNNKFGGNDAWDEIWRLGGVGQANTREDGKGYWVQITEK